MLPVTAVSALALVGFFLTYSVLIIRSRRRLRVPVFDGGDVRLGRIIRAQGNLLEYGLLFVLLTGLSEAGGAPWWWLLALSAVFFAGRALHGYGLVVAEPDEARGEGRFRFRVSGMVITINVLAAAALTLLATLVVSAF